MPRVAADELTFVALNFGITVLMLASFGGHHEDSIRTAAWPLANILRGACLFYFAGAMDFRSIISAAAIGALAIQILGILIDLWIPGILAQWAARPAGFPQNPNNGALLICFFSPSCSPLNWEISFLGERWLALPAVMPSSS
jgi:hypothetical protein